MVSPQVTPSSQFDSLRQTTDAGREEISHQLMEAPKSPLPKQKSPSSELPAILDKIAFCESSDRQFDADGGVIRGVVNPADVGRYQINTYHWGVEAKKRGFDLHTEEGNEAMALYLYQKFGTKPWKSSQKCWDKETSG